MVPIIQVIDMEVMEEVTEEAMVVDITEEEVVADEVIIEYRLLVYRVKSNFSFFFILGKHGICNFGTEG
jgi:hypothetical protein